MRGVGSWLAEALEYVEDSGWLEHLASELRFLLGPEGSDASRVRAGLVILRDLLNVLLGETESALPSLPRKGEDASR